MSNPNISCRNNVGHPRLLKCLDLVPRVHEIWDLSQHIMVLWLDHKCLLVPEVLYELVHVEGVLRKNSNCLQTMLAIDDSKFALCRFMPICLCRGGNINFGHDTQCLLIPLNIGHEIIDFPFNTYIMASHDDPLVWRFLTLKTIHFEVQCCLSGQQSFESWLNSNSILVVFRAYGLSPSSNSIGIRGSKFTYVPSLIEEFSISSFDLFEDVDCLLGLWLAHPDCLLIARTCLGAPLIHQHPMRIIF